MNTRTICQALAISALFCQPLANAGQIEDNPLLYPYGISAKYATPAELASTNLTPGQLVANQEDFSDLRVGDGHTPGGVSVASPEIRKINAELHRSGGKADVRFELRDDGKLWVAEGPWSEEPCTVEIPAYHDGREVAGIAGDSDPESWANVTQLVCHARSIGIRYEALDLDMPDSDYDADASAVRVCGPFKDNTNLEVVIWTHPHAEFAGALDGILDRKASRLERFAADLAGTSDKPAGSLKVGGPFSGCTNLQSFLAPALRDIPANAFQRCHALAELDIPAAERIGCAAFRDSAVTNLFFPQLRVLGCSAFADCTNLELCVFGSPVEIRAYAFCGCKNLKSKRQNNLGNDHFDTATYIGSGAFAGCTNMRGAFYANAATTVLSVPPDATAVFANSATRLVLPPGDRLKRVSANALPAIKAAWTRHAICGQLRRNVNLEWVSAESARFVGAYAFYGCTNLSEARMGSIERADTGAFKNTRLRINFQNLRECGGTVFAGNTAMQVVDGNTLPSLETCGPGLFSGCPKLRWIDLPHLRTVGYNLAGSAKSARIGGLSGDRYQPCTNLNAVILPEATRIGGGMAAGCTNLRTFRAPKLQWCGGYMIAQTPCRTGGEYWDDAAQEMVASGLTFPALTRCSYAAFAYATNAGSFSAPNLSDTSWGATWLSGSWTNIYVPSLHRLAENHTLGCTNNPRVIWHRNLYDPDTCTLFWDTSVVATSDTTYYVPTNFPTKRLCLYLDDSAATNITVTTPANWDPGREIEIEIVPLCIPSTTTVPSRSTHFTIAENNWAHDLTSATTYRRFFYRYSPDEGQWRFLAQSLATFPAAFTPDGRRIHTATIPANAPATVEEWLALHPRWRTGN